MKTVIILTAAGLLGPVLLTAQPRPQAPNPELAKAMHHYVDAEMAPALREAQGAFDAQLPAADLAILRELRTKAAALRNSGRSLHRQMSEAREAGKAPEEVREQFRDALHRQQEAGHALHTELHPLLDRNRSLLQTAMEELKPKYDQWLEAQKAILDEYRPAEAEKPLPGPPPPHGLFGLMPPPAPGGLASHHAPGMMPPPPLAVEFVLWDGRTPPAPETAPAEQPETTGRREGTGLLQNFPNPAVGSTVIRFQLPAAADRAIITIADAQGRIVRTLDLGQVGPGFNEVEVDVSNLEAGVYSYTLEAGTLVETRRMVIGE